jgi:hypothetical protein
MALLRLFGNCVGFEITMRNDPDPLPRRLRWLTWGIALILVPWRFLSGVERCLAGLTTEPRSVNARGELACVTRVDSVGALFARQSDNRVRVREKLHIWRAAKEMDR